MTLLKFIEHHSPAGRFQESKFEGFIIEYYGSYLAESGLFSMLKSDAWIIKEFPASPNLFLGDFVVDIEDDDLSDMAIVVYDHDVVEPDSDLFTIKRIKDGHLSNRKRKQLRKLTPLEFVRKWCDKQIGSYGVYENNQRIK